MINNVSLDTYGIFKDVYENRNIAQTANKLNVSASSISYRIKILEDAIFKINKIYIEMAGGICRPVTEYKEVPIGISFKEYNDYINLIDENKRGEIK